MTTYTLIYFQPSSRGYDYTDGFLDSDDELSIEVADNYQELVTSLTKLQFGVYKANKTKRSFELDKSEYSYKLLVDGVDSYDVEVEPVEFYHSLAQVFDEYVKSDFTKLVKDFDCVHQTQLQKERQELAQRGRNERLRQYEELQKEFGK